LTYGVGNLKLPQFNAFKSEKCGFVVDFPAIMEA